MRASRSIAAALAALLCLGLVAAPAGADEAPPKVGSDDVADANRAVTRAAAVLADTRAQLQPARAALRQARTTVARARAEVAATKAAAAAARAEVARAEQQLAVAQAALVQAQDDVGALARAAYMQGPYRELEAILSARDPGDFAEKLAVVRSLGQSYGRSIAELGAARAELGLRQAQATAALARADEQAAAAAASLTRAASARSAAARAKAAVRALVAQRAGALAVARSRADRVAEQYRRYRAYQARIAAQTRAAASGGGSGSAGPVASGSLVWPVAGGGTSGGVGWRVHPVYGYRSCHTGVDIRGATGTPIRAAAAGTVTSVVNGGAYGLHTIISHGGGLATMYAHQSRSAVRAGQHVAAGQVIGYVGSSGWATGPHLHFEVHVNGVPYDPMGWFGGTRRPVPCI